MAWLFPTANEAHEIMQYNPGAVKRWWIRNTRTQQVLGSVYAQEEDEAIGKAMVKWGVALWQRDGFTAQLGGSDDSNSDASRNTSAGYVAKRKHRVKGLRAPRGGGQRPAGTLHLVGGRARSTSKKPAKRGH